MNKRTAGKWVAAAREGDYWYSVVHVPGTPYEICQCFHDEASKVECEANARLIAAAPELLEALQGFLDMYVRLVNNDGSGACDPEYDPHVIAARAAIAKATS